MLSTNRVTSEFAQNIFSDFYRDPVTPKATKKDEILSPVQKELKRYKHQDAINFASSVFNGPRCPKLLSGHFNVQQYTGETGIRAYYRVILKKPDGRCILSACHVNIHGTHRGDLRFVEINDSTVTRGSEEYSILGKLYLGDIVVVKELVRLTSEGLTSSKGAESFKLDPVWMASRITVLKRNISKVKFSVLEDRRAVAKDNLELMNLEGSYPTIKTDQLYLGDAFIPEKIKHFFARNHHPQSINKLIVLSNKIHQEATPLPTIFHVYTSKALTEVYEIGMNAFNTPSKHGNTPEEIAETCILMGYSAANAFSHGRMDSNSYHMLNVKRNGRFLEFSIKAPSSQWTSNTKIVIEGSSSKDSAVIETVLVEKGLLKITARLWKDVPRKVTFTKGVHLVYQREPLDIKRLKDGFMKELPLGSNGLNILKALYGGPKIPETLTMGKSYAYPAKEPITLNPYQAKYVEMMLSGTPIVVGSSPFGCGKSMTIVTTAYEKFKRNPTRKQLLVTQSNFASVNLVEIAKKIDDKKFKFVRYLSERNSKDLADDYFTDHDLPVLMKDLYVKWAQGMYKFSGLSSKHTDNILNFALKFLEPHELAGQALQMYATLKKSRFPSQQLLTEAFFKLYSPNLIMITADSLHTFLSYGILNKGSVDMIQIDEASQLPAYSFISLLTRFPNVNYGLIGDVHQLPPYCETGLDGKLKEFGIDKVMERAVAGSIFPQAMLKQVYRCHPKTTNLLSGLFYDGKLVAGVTEAQRSEFMKSRPDFWPATHFPILVVDNENASKRMGTSCCNEYEKEVVLRLLDVLTTNYKGYKLQESDIGIISFYAAQTSLLTEALRGRSVKCGTVDAFQGTEREVMILCCTNEVFSDFMKDKNRLNVAMSRAKQVTIVIGDTAGMMKAEYWNTIWIKAAINRCVFDANRIMANFPKPKITNHTTPDAFIESDDDYDDLRDGLKKLRI